MANSKMALRPYIEAIEKYCDQLSQAELTSVIVNLAKEKPVGQRQSFLSKLHDYSPEKKTSSNEDSSKSDLCEQIQALKEDMQERSESIDDGSYWDTLDRDEYDYGYDEEPDYVSDDQADELISYFKEAEQHFLNNRLELAKGIYRQLFDLCDEFDEWKYTIPSSTDTFDLREAKAQYCRCVYETSKKKDRIDETMGAMEIDASVSDTRLIVNRESSPMLQDVMDAKTGDMKGWDDFLKGWNSALKKHQSHRAHILLLEVTLFLKGVKGVSSLARKWGKIQPRGYLYWIQGLFDKQEYTSASSACLEALKTLPNSAFREQVADYLMQCGENLKDRESVLTGKREKFRSSSGETNLLDLIDEANRQGVREKELDSLRSVFKKPMDLYGSEKNLHTKYLLLTGDVKAAYDDDKKPKCVGWSYGKTGLVFGSVLYLVSGKSDEAITIKNLLERYANKSSGYSDFFESASGTRNITMYEEILEGLQQCTLATTDHKLLFNWAKKIGCSRIDHIVSNKHRKAYERAATVLGALSECYILLDKKAEAQQLTNTFYVEKYNRYPAFKQEVKSVFNASVILRSLRI
jgi:hypothetical protein